MKAILENGRATKAAFPEKAALSRALRNGAKASKPRVEEIKIAPLRQQIIAVTLRGTEPYMQNRFSEKAIRLMKAKHEAGSQATGKKIREKRDFDADVMAGTHFFKDGTVGIHAGAFRNAAISACRTVGFAMTKAKLSIFVLADGYDRACGTPLVRIFGKPEPSIMAVRNDSGVCDLRARPLWREWSVKLRVRFDLEQFSVSDVVNLLIRAGAYVGIGEGRPDSPNSNGMGYGLFDVEIGDTINDQEAKKQTGRKAGPGGNSKKIARKAKS